MKVYERYLKLDLDHNGLLKKSELQKYSWGLTNVFIDRVFEECQTFDGEMDYKTFLDFVLAMENKKTTQSLQYFFKILDVYHKKAIDTFVINMFFRPIVQKLEQKEKFGKIILSEALFAWLRTLTPSGIRAPEFTGCPGGSTASGALWLQM